MEDIFAMISAVTPTDIALLGSFSTAILAIIALSKQLTQFLIEFAKFICWTIWNLILIPAFYISLWIFQGISFLVKFTVDKLRRLCK